MSGSSDEDSVVLKLDVLRCSYHSEQLLRSQDCVGDLGVRINLILTLSSFGARSDQKGNRRRNRLVGPGRLPVAPLVIV